MTTVKLFSGDERSFFYKPIQLFHFKAIQIYNNWGKWNVQCQSKGVVKLITTKHELHQMCTSKQHLQNSSASVKTHGISLIKKQKKPYYYFHLALSTLLHPISDKGTTHTCTQMFTASTKKKKIT